MKKITSNREFITEEYSHNGDVVFANGLDDAIIGFEPNFWRVVYSRRKVIEILMADGMSHEEAIEFADVNVFGALVGEQTPLWIEDFNN